MDAMRRGITPVVAIVLLLMMTVAASGGAYAWITSTTQQAQSDASQGLATELVGRSVSCSGSLVDIGISNTGETGVDVSEAELYVEADGDLVSGRTGIDTGEATLSPGGFGRYRFLAAATLAPGTRYSIEVRFPNDDVTVTGTCDGGSATSAMSGWWPLDGDTLDRSGNGNDGNREQGMRSAYASGNIQITANQWDGSSNNGEFDITCPGGDAACWMMDANGNHSGFTIDNGVACGDSNSGTGYIMYSAENVHDRFSGDSPHSANAHRFICTRYSGGWEYDTNNDWVSFDPRATDTIVASVDFDADTVSARSFFPEPGPGQRGEAFTFDGVEDRIRIPDSAVLDDDLASGFTLAVWVNITVPDGGDGTAHQLIGKDTDYSLHIQPDGTLRLDNDGNGGFEHDMGAIDGWTHIAASVESDGDGSLFVDGQRIGTGTFPLAQMGSSNPVFIGAREWGGERYATGPIDEVQIIPHTVR